MRVRRLLFLLVPIVLGGTIPLHAALGPAPLCLAPVDLQATPETVAAINARPDASRRLGSTLNRFMVDSRG